MAERDRRQTPDRRSDDGRRRTDYEGRVTPITVVATVCGALVVLYLFFLVAGGVDPADDPGWGIAALALALVWLAYSGRRLWRGGGSPSRDRERRGF
jgi:type VI protein secretion system component VasF